MESVVGQGAFDQMQEPPARPEREWTPAPGLDREEVAAKPRNGITEP
jgi:hypothetical protein